MRKINFILLIIFCSLSALNAQQKTADIIKKIENQLTTAILIEGEPQAFFTITERMKHYNVPGLSIAFIKDYKIDWTKTYGYTSFDSTMAIDNNTLFQAASISKPVAAMGALWLVQEGKLSLDADVNKYLKNWQVEENRFTEKEKVTLARILSHSAGLTVHGFAGYSAIDTVPDIIQILNGTKPANSDKIKPDTIPGLIWRYSGGGYTIMQKMVTDITKIPFPEFMQKTVLSKLGMNNSTYSQPLPLYLHKNASIGHRPNGDSLAGKWHTYPEMAAAGLWTTPSDLAKLAIEVQKSLAGKSNKVLSTDFTKMMVTRYKDDYALGFGIGGKGDSILFEHGGANEGYRCMLLAFTNLKSGIVIMTNSDNGMNLITEILRSVSRAYNWSIYKTEVRKVIPLEAEKIKLFEGKYKLNEGMEVEINFKDNKLMAKQSWDNIEYPIYPESDYTFFEKEGGISFVFQPTGDGKIGSFIVYGQYIFNKIE